MLKKLKALLSRKKGPWASFEIVGFESDGRIKVVTNWNKQFIDKIQELGFHAETEEESVQLFFYTAQARPTAMLDGDEEEVAPSEHPNLAIDKKTYLRT